MKKEYINLIAELDQSLSIVRVLWLEAKDAAEEAKWRLRMDQLLDERIRLMRCRDAIVDNKA